MARNHYQRLLNAGVEIYAYEPGIVNGVRKYRCDCLKDIKQDFAETLEKCIRIDESRMKQNLMQRFVRSVVKVFTPML